MLLYSIALVAGALLILAAAAWVVRAAVRSSDEGPPAWSWVVAAAGALLAVPIVVVCAFFFLPAPVAERTLLHSIERETPSVGSDLAPSSGCHELRDSAWRCVVGDLEGSGGTVRYAVTAGTSCWRARLPGLRAASGMPARADGCARLRDVLGLFDY